MAVSKENGKKLIDELLGDLSKASAAKQMALGTSMGCLTGFVTMKIGKAAAIVTGGSILLLQIAHHKGYLRINSQKLAKDLNKLCNEIEKGDSGKTASKLEKVEEYVDDKLTKMEDKLKSKATQVRRWYHSLVNNGDTNGYQLQELHIFMASFAAGLAFGFAAA